MLFSQILLSVSGDNGIVHYNHADKIMKYILINCKAKNDDVFLFLQYI